MNQEAASTVYDIVDGQWDNTCGGGGTYVQAAACVPPSHSHDARSIMEHEAHIQERYHKRAILICIGGRLQP